MQGEQTSLGMAWGAVLGIAGLVWGSSTIQHQIQLQVATVNLNSNPLLMTNVLLNYQLIILQKSRRELTGSISSEGDIDADVDGIELEVIPESPKSSRPDPDWNRDSFAEVEVKKKKKPDPKRFYPHSYLFVSLQ